MILYKHFPEVGTPQPDVWGAYIQPLTTITAGQGFEGCMGSGARIGGSKVEDAWVSNYWGWCIYDDLHFMSDQKLYHKIPFIIRFGHLWKFEFYELDIM